MSFTKHAFLEKDSRLEFLILVFSLYAFFTLIFTNKFEDEMLYDRNLLGDYIEVILTNFCFWSIGKISIFRKCMSPIFV